MARTLNVNLMDEAALWMAAGADVRTAARRLGIAPGTLYRWGRDAEFRGRVESYRRELRARTISFLAAKAARLAGDDCPRTAA